LSEQISQTLLLFAVHIKTLIIKKRGFWSTVAPRLLSTVSVFRRDMALLIVGAKEKRGFLLRLVLR